MSMRTWAAALLAVALAAVSFSAPAYALDAATQQHINELQAQIAALEAQAQQYRNGIAAQQDKAASLQRDIAILQGQVGQLQAQINATDKKIELTQTQIGETSGQIDAIQTDIDQQRGAIGRMVLFLDERDHENIVASLFKYADLSSFLQQFHDLAQVQDKLVQIIGSLKQSRADLELARTDLQSKQDQLQSLNDQAAQQQRQIALVQGQKARVLKDTKGQEAAYQKQLNDVLARESAFFQEMEKLESQVIAGGLYIVHITATTVPKKSRIFIKPEDNPRMTQSYGCTTYARCGRASGPYGGAGHNGVDFASGYSTPIKAIGDGTVIAHGTNGGWGNWVAIQHPNNLVSLYAHMSAFAPIPVGTAVHQGQVIGYEGNTGEVTGSHVHLSIYKDFFTYVNPKNGQLYFNYFEGTVNPLNYL